jgi:hypothetical protein
MEVLHPLRVVDVLDSFLTHLSREGGRHRVNDLSRVLGIGLDKLGKIIDFFLRYDFIAYDEASETVWIKKDVAELYRR